VYIYQKHLFLGSRNKLTQKDKGSQYHSAFIGPSSWYTCYLLTLHNLKVFQLPTALG